MVTAPATLSPARWRRVLQWCGADRAVLFGSSARLWALLAGPLTFVVIASQLSREQQGYYYTFHSLLALQVFVELGLTGILVQFASHEWARLELDEDGSVLGDGRARSRLASLAQLSCRWYGTGAVVFFLGMAVAGSAFFASAASDVEWLGPWVALCLAESAVLALLPLWALLEGCNQVSAVWGYRLCQAVVTTITIWLGILLGAGLWAPALASAASLLLGAAVLARRHRRLLGALLRADTPERIGWRDEIWPLQRRVGLSWLSGYLSFSLFTPVLFRTHGPELAGRMGMTASLYTTLSSISAMWVATKAPAFGALVARREFRALDRLALRAGVAAVAVAVAGGLAIEAGLVLLGEWAPSLAARLLAPGPTALFLVATVLLQCSIPQATYLRAHKREPFLGISVVGGALTAVSTVVLGSRYGANGVAAGYLAVTALVVGLGTVIFFRCRAAWHEPQAGLAA